MKGEQFMKIKKGLFGSSLVLLLILASAQVAAGPYGFDLHNVLSPRAAGIAGTNIAGDTMGPVEATFGNPANLTDFQGGTHFTFGASVYYPEVLARHRRGDAPGPIADRPDFNVRSSANPYVVPQIAVTQDLAGVGVPVVLGVGLSVVSGIGVDYRRDDATLGTGAELIFLGVNAGAGYEVNDHLDVGAAITVTYAMLDAGLLGSNAQSHDYGARLTLGADYHLTDHTDIGFYYQTKLHQQWDDSILLSDGGDTIATYEHLSMQQPMNLAFGIAHEFTPHFRVMSDVIFKKWSDANFWERFYHDQTAFSIGAELDQGPYTWRVGYGYANDPTRDRIKAEPLSGKSHVCAGIPGAGPCLPLTGEDGLNTWRYLQAMETPVIYEHRVSAGMTWDGFIAPFLTLDTHVAYQIREHYDYTYVNHPKANTELGVSSYHAGFALTWNF